MTAIGTNHRSAPAPEHPVAQRWLAADSGLIARLRQHLSERQAHPARSLVLVPYAQLIPVLRRMWQRAVPDGFAPRVETSATWARSVAAVAAQPHDLVLDRARDLLTAQGLLDSAGLGAQRDILTTRLLDAAYSLAPLVAALPLLERAAWGQQARLALGAGMDAPALALELAVARVALEWALASSYPTDALLAPSPIAQWDSVIVLAGLQDDPWSETLLRLAGARGLSLPLTAPAAASAPLGQIRVHAAHDPEDEAQRAAACVLQHLRDGHEPVALIATDRVLVRRIRAMLGLQGVRIRDETGWKLSTTRAAAQTMAALRACRWDASTDQVLDWLKNAPALAARPVSSLERLLRRHGVAQWRTLEVEGALKRLDPKADEALAELLREVHTLRAELSRTRPLGLWLAVLHALLVQSGLWSVLSADAAGARLIDVLRLAPAAHGSFDGLSLAARRLSLADFTAWADQVLEAASFVPQPPSQEQVVILPLSQVLARPMAALVLPGCDEQRLNPSPEPPGDWTPAQRLALRLPSREALAAAQRAAWREALQTPQVDLLWRRQDEAGEPVLPSPLLQSLQVSMSLPPGTDARRATLLPAQSVTPPQPHAERLPLRRISATAYEDLRRCPYRFFALRLLGLQEADELDLPVDKRDFGLWLHEVLDVFQHHLQAAGGVPIEQRVALLDAAMHMVSERQQLDAAEFLPFAAAWPRLRDGYLAWLQTHEASGARFEQGESAHEQGLGDITLFGKVDRVDAMPDGLPFVIDYKTESDTQTRARLKDPFEDTQLAFYAALLPQDSLRAAYVNVGEKSGSKTYEQLAVVEARDALIEGLLHDLQRIHAGAALPALGEGPVCDFCAARGLCRKDSWTAAEPKPL